MHINRVKSFRFEHFAKNHDSPNQPPTLKERPTSKSPGDNIVDIQRVECDEPDLRPSDQLI